MNQPAYKVAAAHAAPVFLVLPSFIPAQTPNQQNPPSLKSRTRTRGTGVLESRSHGGQDVFAHPRGGAQWGTTGGVPGDVHTGVSRLAFASSADSQSRTV